MYTKLDVDRIHSCDFLFFWVISLVTSQTGQAELPLIFD